MQWTPSELVDAVCGLGLDGNVYLHPFQIQRQNIEHGNA